MRKYILSLLFAICGLHIAGSVCSQDLHFSQFFHSPLSTNPANTGFIPDGDYRIGANFRDQWSTVMSVPYKTISAYGDVQLMKERFTNGWVGAGGLIMRDVAGSGNLTSTKVYGSIAYHQMLGFSSLLSLGFNVGYANKQINRSNLKFPDQFDGKFFDHKMPTSAVLRTTSTGYMDMQVGMNYAYFPNDKVYMNAGFSTHHVNRGNESFFSTDSATGPDNGVPMRHIGFLNGSWMISDQWIINPNIYYTTQAKSYELVAGMNAQYNLSGDGEYQLLGGLYYRHKDAVIPMIGLGVKSYQFSFTYDATISSLNRFNQTRGAFELSLTKQGLFDQYNGNRRETLCPSFRN